MRARIPETGPPLPCEIRLICRRCRSSFMINSPACWKQCFCALATCGTDVKCVWATARLTARLPTLTSCSGCVDVVNAVEHESTACHKSCALCTVLVGHLLAARVWQHELKNAWSHLWHPPGAIFKEVGDMKGRTPPLPGTSDSRDHKNPKKLGGITKL